MAAPKQGGFKMSLGSLKSKPGLKVAAPQKHNAPKQSRLALLGDDEMEDTNQKQEISGWDTSAGGAVDMRGAREKTPPRVIPVEPNRDWRADMRKKQLEKAPHLQAKAKEEEDMAGKAEEMKFGLTILKKNEPEGEEEDAAPGEPMEDVQEQDNLTEAQRLEKKALEALLHGKATDEHVIPVEADEEAFRKDVDDAPEAPTLAAYEATPIEGFGAALLRGMGWKGEDNTAKNGAATKNKEPKRRPALLGIGAKEEAAVGVELGEWSKKGKRGKGVTGYNPVALKNKRTGELITEEELKAKLESQDKLVEDEGKPEKESRRDYSNGDDERREKRKDRRDDGYDGRHRRREKKEYYDDDDDERRPEKRRDKHRDEDYDSERRRDRRRDRDADYNSERRSEKRRDRDRRERSRSPRDDKRDSRRDRYRSRSRDSKRRDRSRDADDRRERRKYRDYDDEREDRKRR